MKRVQMAAWAAFGLGLALGDAAAAASLLNQSLSAKIQITGDDDAGFYTLDVLNGPLAVGSGYSQTFSVFKQHIRGGFGGASNQLFGNLTLQISADTIAINFTGQSQGVRLTSSFSGIAGQVLAVSHTGAGFVDGIMVDEGAAFTPTSVRTSLLLLGYEPSVNVTQTEVLTFAADPPPGVPEPGTWALMILGFGAAGAALRRRPAGSRVPA